jgi:HNH endonuclease
VSACLCGCGETPRLPKSRYVRGHGRRGRKFSAPLRQRVLAKLVIDPSGCVLWTGQLNGAGYGEVYVDRTPGRRQTANANFAFVHRLMYEWFVGPIPEGLVIDHLCRTPRCASPAHLEAVTQRENVRRGMGFAGVRSRQTHCIRDHEFTEANTYISGNGTRHCKECARIRDQRRAATPQRVAYERARSERRREARRLALGGTP